MSMPTAQLELTRSTIPEARVEPGPPDEPGAPDEIVHHERPLVAARGIVNAMLISVPFWALFGFTLYLLI